MRFLSAADVKKILTIEKAIDVMRDAFVSLSKNDSVVPLRTQLSVSEHNGNVLLMPAYNPGIGKVGLKFLSLFEDNPKQHIPAINALVVIMDAVDGRVKGLMDGSYITAMRTGAGSGVATDLLARPEAETVVIFGAGAQARTQLEAVCAVRKITGIHVLNRDRQKGEEFASEMSEKLSLNVTIAKSRSILKEADIICTATSSACAVLEDDEISAGVHINAIGVYKPDQREIPAKTIARAKVYVDHFESCLEEAGDILLSADEGFIDKNHVHAEIGEVLTGAKTGRDSEDQVTLYKSVGNAVKDLFTADYVLKEAEKLGLGMELNL